MTFDGQPVLLMHGDTLCTDDKDYQKFRGLVRSSSWQTGFLAQTPAVRMQQAAEYRQQSQAMTAIKSEDIMDVNSETVDQVMHQHQVNLLIHGHTHRPKVHHSGLGDRIVLGDWGGHFDYLSWPKDENWHLIRESIWFAWLIYIFDNAWHQLSERLDLFQISTTSLLSILVLYSFQS